MKLQQAYFAEANKAGDWQLIGYTAPGTNSNTNNFLYEQGWSGGPKETDQLSAWTAGWLASNKAKLNECEAGRNWGVAVKFDDNQDVYASATTGSACKALTPTFDEIGGNSGFTMSVNDAGGNG